ncbi:PDZ domain-containing protein [bacterium]|nr:PDZ domain-containing protein [bacterium]
MRSVQFLPRILLTVFLSLTTLSPDGPALAQVNRAALELAEEQAFKEATVAASPSIVRIDTVGGLDMIGRQLTSTASTTGLIVEADGFIVSSAFNFISKPTSILVTLPDGRRFPAKIVATDRLRMITLLKIEASGLKTPQLSLKSEHRVGQWSIALGRTYDTTLPSVSVGLISALNRVWGKAIQTDAKVSPVNYGGPLVDIRGRVMGVLVPLSPQADSEAAGVEWYDSGIGFAVPLDDILRVLPRLKEGQDLRPGLAGVTFKTRDPNATLPAIDRVRYDSPAWKAELKSGDQIVQVNGQPIERMAHLMYVLKSRLEGETLTVTVKRGDEELTRSLTLVAEVPAYESGFLGVLPERTTGAAGGVRVRFVFPDSPAAKAQLESGDRIVSLNNDAMPTATALLDRVSRLRPAEKVELAVERDGKSRTVSLELSSIPETIPENLPAATVAKPEQPADGKTEQAADAKARTPANADGEKPKIGRFAAKLDGYDQEHWAYVPDDWSPDRTWSLLVWIHPTATSMEATIFNRWKSICDHRGILLLAPKSKSGRNWTPNETEYVRDVVRDFSATYKVAVNRIAIHGFDDGGVFAAQVAFEHRELFSGIILAGTGLREAPPENLPDFRQQLLLVSGINDPATRLVGLTADAIRALRFPVTQLELDDLGHEYPKDESIDQLARWLDSLDRI